MTCHYCLLPPKCRRGKSHTHTPDNTSSIRPAAHQKQRKTYDTRVGFNNRLLDQLMRHYDYHSFLFLFLQLQLTLLTHSQHSIVHLRAQQTPGRHQVETGTCKVGHVVVQSRPRGCVIYHMINMHPALLASRDVASVQQHHKPLK